ncbi:MAG TPA: glutamine--tRNA ligase, partial [Chromatiales bacterium]|nr:glutamine--tRNA ligase [Chromatiales bacterium]
VEAEVRMVDRLFAVPAPGSRREGDAPDLERNFLDDLNPESKSSVRAMLEPSLAAAAPESRFQFERHGYFVADQKDHQADKPVYNRTVTLRDSWSKG